MNIDDFKNEYKKMRGLQMDISINGFNNPDDFLQIIKKQDREDEKYLLHNKMIPIIIGLFFITIIMLLNPIKTAFLLIGTLLIFLGLFCTLILLMRDYRTISKESYDLSLLAYLKQKEKRLKSWHSTPTRYQWTFTVFISGLVLMLIGNASLLRDFSTENTIAFIAVYLVLLTASWIIGEHFYRKRHRKQHQPLLKIISAQIKELSESDN